MLNKTTKCCLLPSEKLQTPTCILYNVAIWVAVCLKQRWLPPASANPQQAPQPSFCFCIISLRHLTFFTSNSTFVDSSKPGDLSFRFGWWHRFESAAVEKPEHVSRCSAAVAAWGSSPSGVASQSTRGLARQNLPAFVPLPGQCSCIHLG